MNNKYELHLFLIWNNAYYKLDEILDTPDLDGIYIGPADLSLPTMIESSLVMVLKSEVRTSRTDLTNLRSSKKPISKVNTLPHNLPTSISSIILEEVFISVLPVQKPIIFGGNPNPNSRTLTLNSLAVKK